jgi:hypothetical protein
VSEYPGSRFYSYRPTVQLEATGLDPDEQYSASFKFDSDDGSRHVTGGFSCYDRSGDGDVFCSYYQSSITKGKAGTLTAWIRPADEPGAAPVETDGGPAITTYHLP